MNATDTAVIAQFDNKAVASVGSTGTIIALLVSSLCGIAEGAKIILARTIGTRDYERCKTVVSTAMITAAILGSVIAVLGSILARPMLLALNCPDDCIDGASTYLSIYFLASPIILLYNFGAGIIAISGNSVKPMMYMIISGATNVVFNVIFCFIFPNKIVAVALATVLGATVSCILVMRDLIQLENYRLDFKNLKFSISECKLIFKIGIPVAFNGALFSISNMQISSALFKFGSSAIAGNTAAVYIESITSCVNTAVASATNAFCGQNLGAKNTDRVKKTIRICLILGVLINVPLSFLLYAFNEPILSIFVPGDAAAIAFAQYRLRHILLLYGMCIVTSVLGSTIQSFGYTTISSLNSIICVLVFRAVWMTFVYPSFEGSETMLFVCYSISWTLSFIATLVAFIIIFKRYLRGKIRTI